MAGSFAGLKVSINYRNFLDKSWDRSNSAHPVINGATKIIGCKFG
jgi:hypothetical protein